MSRLTAPHGHRGAGRRVHVLGVACEQNPLHHLPCYPPPIRRPYPATSHRLRMLRHPVAAVHVQRKRRCSSPFPLWTSAKHWRLASGDCTSPHSQPSNEPSPPRGNTFFFPPMESAAFVKRHLGDPDSICFQADEAATKTNTTRTATSMIPERRSTPSTSTWIPGC